MGLTCQILGWRQSGIVLAAVGVFESAEYLIAEVLAVLLDHHVMRVGSKVGRGRLGSIGHDQVDFLQVGHAREVEPNAIKADVDGAA